MSGWIAELRALVADGGAAVLVTVAGSQGSVPREAGTRMLVTADRLIGTIGGGNLEYQATEMAREMLSGGEAAMAWHDFALGPSLDQCCGGRVFLALDRLDAKAAWWEPVARAHLAGEVPVVVSRLDTGAKLVVTAAAVTGSLGAARLDAGAVEAARTGPHTTRLVELEDIRLLIDPVRAPDGFDVVLFGAGHVGKAIVAVLAPVPGSRITWIDDREEQLPSEVAANVRTILTPDPAAEAGAIPPGAFVLVMSHKHALDYDIVGAVLRGGGFRYCGLIGSATKRARFEARWREGGHSEEALSLLTCPIGVPGVGGKAPAEIAIGVAAQILALREADAAEAAEAKEMAVPGELGA